VLCSEQCGSDGADDVNLARLTSANDSGGYSGSVSARVGSAARVKPRTSATARGGSQQLWRLSVSSGRLRGASQVADVSNSSRLGSDLTAWVKSRSGMRWLKKTSASAY